MTNGFRNDQIDFDRVRSFARCREAYRIDDEHVAHGPRSEKRDAPRVQFRADRTTRSDPEALMKGPSAFSESKLR